MERFLIETMNGSASKPIAEVKLNAQGTMCALVFEDGELQISEFSVGKPEVGVGGGGGGANNVKQKTPA